MLVLMEVTFDPSCSRAVILFEIISGTGNRAGALSGARSAGIFIFGNSGRNNFSGPKKFEEIQ
jgi:hypothetical protein